MWDEFECHGNAEAIDSHIQIISDSKETEFVFFFIV